MALEIQDICIIVIIAYLFSHHDIMSTQDYGAWGYVDDAIVVIVLIVLMLYTIGLLALIMCLNDPQCKQQLEEQRNQNKKN